MKAIADPVERVTVVETAAGRETRRVTLVDGRVAGDVPVGAGAAT